MQGRWERLSPEERAISHGKLFPELKTNEEVAAQLKQVRVPTFLLYAAQDDIIPPEMALLAARSVEGSKLVLYQDHSHSLAGEAPEQLVQEVRVFLNELVNPSKHDAPAGLPRRNLGTHASSEYRRASQRKLTQSITPKDAVGACSQARRSAGQLSGTTCGWSSKSIVQGSAGV